MQHRSSGPDAPARGGGFRAETAEGSSYQPIPRPDRPCGLKRTDGRTTPASIADGQPGRRPAPARPPCLDLWDGVRAGAHILESCRNGEPARGIWRK